MMKEGPILFTTANAVAILDGNKTQTRRIAKITPDQCEDIGIFYAEHPCPYGQTGDRLYVKETFYAFGTWKKIYDPKKERKAWHFEDLTIPMGMKYQFKEPAIDKKLRRRGGVIPTWWKRPSIFMPRIASRILLEITGVRVERLQDISEADALAEGVTYSQLPDNPQDDQRARTWYRGLWEMINGNGSWAANPWVWVVEFRRIASCK